jgi:hypothetical protein
MILDYFAMCITVHSESITPMANTKLLAFRLPDAIRAELKATAEKEGRTMSNMILRLITEGLESRRIAK